MTAYIIVDIDVTEPEAYSNYTAQSPGFVHKYQGQFVVRGGNPETIEGEWRPSRLVVVQFPSKELAQAFLADAEYQAIADIRRATTISHMVLVEGAD